MKPYHYQNLLPNYEGQQWLKSELPQEGAPWLNGREQAVRHCKSSHHKAALKLKKLLTQHTWDWPKRPIYFLTDPHADGEAFMASLVASGGIRKIGHKDKEFELTESGKKAIFIIGGDCFDKGPSNLRLIRCVQQLKNHGARLKLLAGNHDLRVMFGMRCVGLQGDTRNEHFFIRMGAKAIPFLKEINDTYLKKKSALRGLPSEEGCRTRLYPSENWYEQFPKVASWVMPPQTIEREMSKIHSKSKNFADKLDAMGLSMRQAYAAALKWQELFWHPNGEFSWLFKEMQVAIRKGSFLFVHAGVDDRLARHIGEQSIHTLNEQFLQQIQGLPFEFYYGFIANSVRTKYRPVDMPLTHIGSQLMHNLGVYAIIHGHRNLKHGQRIAVRKNLVNFECDTTMDINSRLKEGVPGYGAGVTLILPEKVILGVSSDYQHVKVFDYRSLPQ